MSVRKVPRGRTMSKRRPAAESSVLSQVDAPSDALHASCGFPLEGRNEILGVIEFFRTESRPPDPGLMDALADLGRRIGQFMERRMAEERLREREENYRALFEVNPLPMWLRDPD